MGREFYRSEDFIIYHCDGCGEQEAVNCEGADADVGSDNLRKKRWYIWRPTPALHDMYGETVERHFCHKCFGPKTDYPL